MEKNNFKNSTEILLHDYELRKQRNSKYSQRAYAKHLEISSGRLTDLFNGKGNLSIKMANSIAAKLALSQKEKDLFITLVENEVQARPDHRKNVRSKGNRQLQLDEFAVISDWEYFAFMALVETKTFKADPLWIAKKMNLTVQRVQEVIDHLREKNFISVAADGSIQNVHHSLSTLTDIPSEVLKKANIECIQQGIEKVHSVDVQLRDVTSLTFPVALDKMKELKALIREFKLKAQALMDNQTTSEVYNLNIQLVPITNFEHV